MNSDNFLRSKFVVGQLVFHKLMNEKAVIFDVDPYFSKDDDWYQEMATNQPAKKQPWYHVLVNNTLNCAYVAEENLAMPPDKEPILHPQIFDYFTSYYDGYYRLKMLAN
ncbi:heat shock protein HspQ [Sessilibacter sp. MAH2]